MLVSLLHSNGQSSLSGFQYQAVIRSSDEQIIPNLPIVLNVSLSDDHSGLNTYYTEQHLAKTNAQGLFTIIIGEGQKKNGEFSAVPWSKGQMWLKIELIGNQSTPLSVISHHRLLAAPYAIHASTASALTPKDDTLMEKNQSIYWTTSGNSNTRPGTHFMGSRDEVDVAFKTNDTARVILTHTGQMRVKSSFTGKDIYYYLDVNNYPVLVEGSNQGIYIKVNGSRSNANNFLTFADDYGIWGTVEGQTVAELEATWQYQLQLDAYIIESVSIAAQAVSAIGKGVALIYSAIASVAGVASLAAGIKLALDAATIGVFRDTYFTEIHNQVGVSYTTGRADYAEWLERDKACRDLHFGEIVGIKGGKVSLKTSNVDHYRVVSKNPGILGNEPAPEQLPNYEKIAFMGQVLVKVAGSVDVGDYIIPSGNNDGFGLAVNPKAMKAGDYTRIVGVAWESAHQGLFNYINVAVGINSNELSQQVELLERKIDAIEKHLKGEKLTLDGSINANFEHQTTQSKLMSDEEFDRIIDQNKKIYQELYGKIKQYVTNKGIDLNANPQLAAFFDDPTEVIKKMRRDPRLSTQWALADKKIMLKK